VPVLRPRGWDISTQDGLIVEATSRWLVEFLDTVRVSCCDYAAASSGIATSSSMVFKSFMECSEK